MKSIAESTALVTKRRATLVSAQTQRDASRCGETPVNASTVTFTTSVRTQVE